MNLELTAKVESEIAKAYNQPGPSPSTYDLTEIAIDAVGASLTEDDTWELASRLYEAQEFHSFDTYRAAEYLVKALT